MSVFKGKRISAEIYGESHAPEIGVKVTGFPELEIDFIALSDLLKRRKPSSSAFSTKRKEDDEPFFFGDDGKPITDGKLPSSWTAKIYNSDVKSGDYNELYGKPRPSHADYASYLKEGALDYSGGGRFSARLTAPLCVAGGVALQYLKTRGVKISAFVSEVGGIYGGSYKTENLSTEKIEKLRAGEFPSLYNKAEILSAIKAAASDKDSLGGRVDCVVSGLPAGLGDNLFCGLESKIASLVYAIPAVKGVEFGAGFGFAEMRGSKANDPLRFKNGRVTLAKNDAGGINGGISNGADITFSAAFRPTPSIAKEQNTVDLVKKENATIQIKGRHDACVVPRAVPVVECAAALALLDEIL